MSVTKNECHILIKASSRSNSSLNVFFLTEPFSDDTRAFAYRRIMKGLPSLLLTLFSLPNEKSDRPENGKLSLVFDFYGRISSPMERVLLFPANL